MGGDVDIAEIARGAINLVVLIYQVQRKEGLLGRVGPTMLTAELRPDWKESDGLLL